MFDGVPVDQHFHRFIATPASSRSIPPPNSSSAALIQTISPINNISAPTNLNFLSTFDHPLLFPAPQSTLFQFNHDQYNIDSDGQGCSCKADHQENYESWSNDEVIQLLRIKSSSENWFKDLTWEHVSRKLSEMGYKKSSEKCKEKFEDETCRSFSTSAIGYNKSSSRYLISEEDLDEHDHCNNSDQNTHDHLNHVTIDLSTDHQNVINHQEQLPLLQEKRDDQNLEVIMAQGHFENEPIEVMAQPSDLQDDQKVANKCKKRKRKHKKFKMVKGLCVDLVNKMMSQQEEMHKQLLEDMAKRDEEKMEKVEAWRKEETERVEREIHIREHEQEMARERQSIITQYLNKLTSFDEKIQIPFDMNLQELQVNAKNIDKLIISLSGAVTKIPSSEINMSLNPADEDHQQHIVLNDDIGKRWPRDEVLALINIRSSNGIISGNGEVEVDQAQGCIGNINMKGGCGGGRGGSLWERISQGMYELGYKRSAKRCKEKWENINKYFRKTKDANKKRSLESRTCPYYHELSKLYNHPASIINVQLAGTATHHQN